jgi:hypothetical protein
MHWSSNRIDRVVLDQSWQLANHAGIKAMFRSSELKILAEPVDEILLGNLTPA